MARSTESAAVDKFVSGISTMSTFHPSTFAYIFSRESPALQQRALEIFLNLVEVWANQEIEGADPVTVNVTITARRIRDGLKIYQP